VRLALAALALAAADQWIKAAVAATLPVGASRPVVPGLLSLTHVQNRGVAFGLLSSAAPLVPVLVVLTLVVFVTYNKGRQFSTPAAAGIALMAGGAVGNLIDRLRLGYVVDYLDVHIWPVFNLADAAIVTGAGLLLVALSRGAPVSSPRG
jgi:signal peptidase II